MKKIIMLFLIGVFLTGCWDYKDINDRDIALTIGMSKKNNIITKTVETANLNSGKGQEVNSQQIKTNITKGHGLVYEEARNDIDRNNSDPLFLGATKVVIFDETFAKENLLSYLNRLNGLTDSRKTLFPCITLSDMDEIFNSKYYSSSSIGFSIDKNLKFLKAKGLAIVPSLGEVLSKTQVPEIGYLLPCIAIEDNNFKYYGLAVISNSKLVDTIKFKESFGFLYLSSKNLLFEKSIPLNKTNPNLFSFIVKLKNRKIHTEYENSQIHIYIEADFNAHLLYEYESALLGESNLRNLEKIISESLREEMIHAISLSQVKYRRDLFDFYKYFKANNYKEYEKLDWNEVYPYCKIHLNVKTVINELNLRDIHKMPRNHDSANSVQ